MEGLFNSPFMLKLQEAGQNLGRNKFLSALQATMMSLMAVIMVGAISQIVCAVGSEHMLNLFKSTDQIYTILYTPYQFTMNMLSLWVVALLAYNFARSLDIETPIISVIEALVCFLVVAGTLSTTDAGATVMATSYLSSTGMFVGFLVAGIVVRIDRLCKEKNVYIKMPEIVPQFLQDGFAGIVPLLLNVVLFTALNTLVVLVTGGAFNIASGFLALLGVPLGALLSVPGMFVMCGFAALLWCFGIHGTMIVYPIIVAPLLQALSSNAAAVAAGGQPEFYPVLLFGAMAVCGGTGNTLPLVLMSLRSKSEQLRAVGKAAIVPGWFNINEPVAFGMPIMYNPILCIPYVLSILLVMLCTLIGYQTGVLMPSWIPVVSLLPMGFGGYLQTLNPFNFVWDYLMIIPAGLIWFPFFKAYEKQLVAREEAAKAEEMASGDSAEQ